MTKPSSKDLHPRTGARFVFARGEGGEGGEADAPRYAVAIYLPGGERLDGELRWIEGKAQLELREPDDAPADAERRAWARDEALKLARVLRRDPKQHLVRWRG